MSHTWKPCLHAAFTNNKANSFLFSFLTRLSPPLVQNLGKRLLFTSTTKILPWNILKGLANQSCGYFPWDKLISVQRELFPNTNEQYS